MYTVSEGLRAALASLVAQDLLPAAFDARVVHNKDILAQVETLAAEIKAETGEEAQQVTIHATSTTSIPHAPLLRGR